MFNRSNLPSVPNPFGSGGQRPPQQGYSNPNQTPPRYDNSLAPVSSAGDSRDYDVPMTDASTTTRGYGAPSPSMGRSPQQMPARAPAGRPGGGQTWMLNPAKSPNENYTFGNLYVSHTGIITITSDHLKRCRIAARYPPLPRRYRCPPPHQ
jgi:vesicle-fusing ATPase